MRPDLPKEISSPAFNQDELPAQGEKYIYTGGYSWSDSEMGETQARIRAEEMAAAPNGTSASAACGAHCLATGAAIRGGRLLSLLRNKFLLHVAGDNEGVLGQLAKARAHAARDRLSAGGAQSGRARAGA